MRNMPAMSTTKRAVHVATIRKAHKGKVYVSHLLRHSYREGGKVKHITVANLSDLPEDLIQVMRRRLGILLMAAVLGAAGCTPRPTVRSARLDALDLCPVTPSSATP